MATRGVPEGRGLGVRHAAALPDDVGESRAPVGVHQEGLFHHRRPIGADGGRLRRRHRRPAHPPLPRLVDRRSCGFLPPYFPPPHRYSFCYLFGDLFVSCCGAHPLNISV